MQEITDQSRSELHPSNSFLSRTKLVSDYSDNKPNVKRVMGISEGGGSENVDSLFNLNNYLTYRQFIEKDNYEEKERSFSLSLIVRLGNALQM